MDLNLHPDVQTALFALAILVGSIIGAIVVRYAVASLLKRTPLDAWLAGKLRLEDVRKMDRWIGRFLIILGTMIGLWISARVILGIPSVAAFLSTSVEFITTFISQPAVTLVMDLLGLLIITFLLRGFMRILSRGFTRIRAKLKSWRGTRIKGIKLQNLELISTDRLTAMLIQLTRYLHGLVNLMLVLIYISVILSFFPATRGFVGDILDLFSKAVSQAWSAFVDFLPNLVNIFIISILTYYILRFLRYIFRELDEGRISFRSFYPEWAMPTYQLVKILVLAIGLILIFPYLPGSASPAFQGLSIFFGLLVSLGSSSVVGNIISGIVLTYTRAFEIGHRVEIAETIGDVVEKTLLVTRIKTIKNEFITVPNSMVLGSHIINYSQSVKEKTGLILHASVTLGYDLPWREVHELLIGAANATANILQDPAPFVLQTALDDFFVRYEINAYTDHPAAMTLIYSELYQNIQDGFNEAGYEILSPHYTALRDGQQAARPPEYLPPGYSPPPIVIRTASPESKAPD